MKKSMVLVTTLSKPKSLAVNFILLAVLIMGANIFFAQKFTYLTQTFHYSPQEAYNLLNTIGESGRQAHFNILFVDIAMVVLYSGFLIGANYATFGKFVKKCSLISIITFFPVLLALVQILEIIGVMAVLVNYPTELYALTGVTNILTMIKFPLTGICFVLPLIGLCGIIIKNIKIKKMVTVK